MNLNELTTNIERWAIDRGLDTADSSKQLNKLGEEFGELCSGINKRDSTKTIDAIGDMYVVLTILAMQQDTDIKECIEYAYNEIKDRKGEMVNGLFVKESDLKEVKPWES
ncbi:MazG-like family protein [Oceanobacillus damuensis]|uniref:MazG-like family protein n=1 Tax=Oceanobacillus damuensis TaxID=937928 RepID=UPI00083055BB|nr:MazG-like family protein [Oceanobacillus damuensis]